MSVTRAKTELRTALGLKKAESYAEAIRVARRAAELTEDPDLRCGAYGLIASCHWELGNRRLAGREYRRAADIIPHGYLLVPLAVELWGRGKISESVAQLRRALRREPELEEARYHLGLRYWMMGKFAAGIRELRRASDLDPGYQLACRALGEALVGGRANSQAREAEGVLRRALTLDPQDARARVCLALALWRRGKTKAAAAEYSRAIRGWSSPTPRWCFAMFHSEVGSARRAEPLFAEALKMDPKSVFCHFLWAKHEFKHGEPAAGVTHLRRAAHLGYERAGRILDSPARRVRFVRGPSWLEQTEALRLELLEDSLNLPARQRKAVSLVEFAREL